MGNVSIEEVTAKVLELRGRKASHAEEIKKIEAVVDKLENFLLSTMQEAGLSSMSVLLEDGKATVSHRTSTKVSVGDWDEILKYVLATEKYELLYRNINSRNATEVMESGESIPGTNVYQVETVSIRRT